MPTVHTISGEPVLEGKYHLECRIGQGGMGVVYRARHAYLKTLHAIKIILPDLVGNDPQLVTRFRQEALAAAAIRHQNVVGVSDYGVISGKVPFLVMEYVEGESLHDLLAREKSLSPENSLELMTAICGGVGAAHHQGIVHRDLKPLNIMICSDKQTIAESVKILDFGLAKIKSGELLGSFIQAQTTGLMGSPYYMAPEQWSDDELDSRSDIYSLGVMLFQMLTGDVPFKGSSIPAIMKKHIADPPPTFAEIGVVIAPEIELAIRHTLQKDPQQRTASVEILIDELRKAILPFSQTLPNVGQSLPVSSLSILTRPAQSSIYVDNVSVGQSRDDGWLMLDGVQSGNHHLRVTKDGFADWLGDVICDGKPQKVVAELKTEGQPDVTAIPKPPANTLPPKPARGEGAPVPMKPDMFATRHESKPIGNTINQNFETGQQDISVVSEEKKKALFSPLVFGLIGICGLLLLGIVGIGGAYMLGMIGGTPGGPGNSTATPKPEEVPSIKAEMIFIPGGTFKMGRNDGAINERPAHSVSVEGFQMDKTEVTNAAYYEFVKATNHKPAPIHWVEGKYLENTGMKPVSFVSFEDAQAFAKWRSDRDEVTYRLPTEEEWEFAARNGEKADLYPWGNTWSADNAVINVPGSEPADVGSKASGQNYWGVFDLIGNVYEWTSSELSAYPGSGAEILKKEAKRIIVRGGSAHPEKERITATSRRDVSPTEKTKILGFRLVHAGP
jgi:serine/threonine protein kinase/formylglycine-generating enzyme required for sulfatase activity